MDLESKLIARNAHEKLPERAVLDADRSSVLPDYTNIGQREYALDNLWRILLKHRWVVIATTVIVVTLATIVVFRMTPMYDAACQISINKESSDNFGLRQNNNSDSFWDYAIEIETQTKILSSDLLALHVIRDLQLDKNPAIAGKAIKSSEPAGALSGTDELNADSARQSLLVRNFARNLKVSPIPRTRIIEIHYTSSDPKLAANIANSLASAYIEQNIRTKYESSVQSSDWISNQLSDLKIKVEASQEKLVRYQREHGILGLDDKQNIITAKLDELNRQLTSAEAERIQKETSYRLSLSGDPGLVGKSEPNSVIDRLSMDRAAIQTKYVEAQSTFGPSYPKVVELKGQLDDLDRQMAAETKRIGERIRNDYLAAAQREKMLRAALEDQKQQANQLNESAIEYNIIKRDMETSRQLYEGLLQHLKEAGVSAGLKSDNIRIIDAARPPLKPSSPNIPQNLALALLFGLAGGVMLAFVKESMDNTVRTPDQVQSIAFLPCIGSIPLSDGTSNSQNRRRLKFVSVSTGVEGNAPANALERLVMYSQPRSAMAEAYRALRTSILLACPGAPARVLMVTSAMPMEGKTTTSLNCATVLAQQGSRVLLIDADLRRPRVAQALGLQTTKGLSNLLTGSATMDEVIYPVTEIPTLFVLPSGPVPPQPAELLCSALLKQYLRSWREQFDHIVIDTPPALSVTDPIALSAQVDSVIVVIRAGQTRKEALRRVRDLLAQVKAPVMGVVVNGVDMQSPDHYYYYYGKRYDNAGYYSEKPESRAKEA